MAPRGACLALLALAACATASAERAQGLPASFDARDAFFGCADLVLDQVRPSRSASREAALAPRAQPLRCATKP